jgi:hypothetical protein
MRELISNPADRLELNREHDSLVQALDDVERRLQTANPGELDEVVSNIRLRVIALARAYGGLRSR